jgi:hypothetical protein
MVQMIREAGKRPVQRDALYRVVREYPRVAFAGFGGASPAAEPVAVTSPA